MQEFTMAVHSRLRKLMNRYNMARLDEGKRILSERAFARALGMTHTRLQRLVEQERPWDMETMNACMQFFRLNSFDELFEYTEDEKT